MKSIVGLATFEGREKSLQDTIESLKNQVDEIYIYDNSIKKDIKDNGKFYGLTKITEPCYYFTCDDDIIYPQNYVETMIDSIETFNCIVTHHGKIINEGDYFKSIEQYHFSVRNLEERKLDVAGTAVTAFRTDYFNPKDIINSEDFFVSDLLFAIEAIKQNKNIIHLQHSTNWIKQNMDIDFQKSIS